MATLTIKNIPNRLYGRLKQNAKGHRRSLNSEAIVCLEGSLMSRAVDPEELLARVRAHRPRKVFVRDKDLRAAKSWGRP
jgi:plasmid stability protein